MALVVLLLVTQILTAEGFFFNFANVKHSPPINNGGDPGKPLFLTPYIESGKIEEAKKLARVSLPGLPELESYAGFFTVDKTYNSNLFAWYFPAEQNIFNTTIVWLQGGPGVTSLFGLFDENGPIFVKNNELKRRPDYEYWSQTASVIYIDNPVGTGFSFTESPNGYSNNQTHIGDQLYKALTQFFKLFPKLKETTNLVISGESYGGKHAASLAYTIHKKNPAATKSGDPILPLVGVTIGNGWCDPINQLGYADFLYQVGLICWEQHNEIETEAEATRLLIKNKSWKAALNSWEKLIKSIVHDMYAVSIYNYGTIEVAPSNQSIECNFCKLLETAEIRKAIHVGNLTFEYTSQKVWDHLTEDFMKSVAPWISELLDNYKVWFYNGQQDIIVAYPSTVNFLRQLKWSGSEDYKKAKRTFYIYLKSNDTTLQVGFGKMGGNVTETLVRAAGHMAPGDKSDWVTGLLGVWLWLTQNVGSTDYNQLSRIQYQQQGEVDFTSYP